MANPPQAPDQPLSCNGDDVFKPESITVTPYTKPDNITPLLAGLTDDDWRRQVLTDAKQATENGVLQLKDNTFSGFNLLKTVTDTLFDVVNISDVKIELANAAAVEKPEEEEAAEEDAKTPKAETGPAKKPKPISKRFNFKAEGGVKISGKANLLGLKSADVAMEFSMSNKKEKNALIKVKVSDSEESNNISEILKGGLQELPDIFKDLLAALDKAQLFNPAFAFSTSAVVDTEEPFDVGISEGFNFYSQLKLSDFKTDPDAPKPEKKENNGFNEMLRFLAGVFKIEEIVTRLCIKKSELAGFDFELDTIIKQDLEFSSGKNLNIVFKGVMISIGLEGTPPTPKIAVSTSIELSLSFINADKLLLTGMITLDPKSITPAFTLQANEGPWHPFGLQELSVNALAVEIGATYLKPWIDNFGFKAEEVQIGTVKGSMALKVDTNDYENFGFLVETDEISFIEIATVFCPPVFAAYQAFQTKSPEVAASLEKVINCQVKNMAVSLAPAPITIGELFLDKEGFNAKGEMHLWGWVAKMDAALSANEIDVTAEIDAFSLSVNDVVLVKVEGAENDKNPLFKIYLGMGEKDPEFLMTIAVTILNVRNEVKAEANKDGLKFKFENKSDAGSFLLKSSLDSSMLTGQGAFDFNINEKIHLGKLGDIDLRTAVKIEMLLGIDSKFSLSLKGDIDLAGKTAQIIYEIKEALPDLTDVPENVIAYLKTNAEKLFLSVFKTLAEWADAVKNGAVIFGGNVADVAKDVYKLGDAAVGQIIDAAKKIGQTPAQIASGLKAAYTFSETQVAQALKAASYGADEVAKGLKAAYNFSEKEVAQVLKSAGYAVGEVTNGIKAAYNLTQERIAKTLYNLNYPAHEVAVVIRQAFKADDVAVAIVLKGAGYAKEKVTDALDYGLGLSETGIKKALTGAGYVSAAVNNVLDTINPKNWLF
ncbi:MAG: hypothetical protein JNM14_07610 [Ferruginibacter sp.]|nr:hypothetical protein [Ferruginibacter sp.]